MFDFRLGNAGMSGIEVLRELRTRGCKNSVIFLTGNGTISLAVEAMQLNAIDFLEKPIDHLQLLEAVETTINLCREGLEEKQEEDSIARRIQSLTKRQKEVMECIVEGLPSKRIAKRLLIDIKTVEFHRSQLAKRMEVRSVTELVQLLTRYTLMTRSDHNNLT
jgi:FixJ family two-component response regulator